MATALDLLISMFIGIAIFGILIAGTQNAADDSSFQRFETQTMESLLSTMEVIESDMRNAGAGIADTLPKISKADLSEMILHRVINRGSAKADTIHYSIGPTNEVSKTENPDDRFLYRKLNKEPALRVGVVTEFALRYLTAANVELPVPVPADRLTEINAMELTIEVQSPHAIENAAGIEGPKRYTASRFVSRRFESKNLKR
ncbi:MAG: hypothetical protein KF749_02500 [Bacteroidetes bacterium]|nr:hypothetical protein [Bacteroidota bacterium]MCW5897409.1 hypothetical protein [Bacteroidota bacterium]